MTNINFLSFVIALLKSLFVFVTNNKKEDLIHTINYLDATRCHILIEQSDKLSNDAKDIIHNHIDELADSNEIINIASCIRYEISHHSNKIYTARFIKQKGKFHIHKYIMTIIDRSNGKDIIQYKTNKMNHLSIDYIYEKYGICVGQINEGVDTRGIKFKSKHIFLQKRKAIRRRKPCFV